MNKLSEDEFANLFRESHTRLWTVAVAMIGDRSRAEDLVQDAAMVGLNRLADFQPGSNFVAWMSQIVRYQALNELKRRKTRKTETPARHSLEEAAAPEDSSGPAAVTKEGELVQNQQVFDDQLVEALEALEPERRACLLLRVVEGLTYDEIAEILEVPAGTAMSHVHRAKSALRGALGEGRKGGVA